MKWYVIPSLVACGLNCTLGVLVLSLAIFHLYTDKSTNAPIPPNEEWIDHVKSLIPFSLIWITASLVGIFVSMARNRIWLASSTLAAHVICFGVAVYFACAFGVQLEMEDVPVESIVNLTQTQINNAETSNWIPGWLDNIQKQSKQCCGVLTYRDYEQFWPGSQTKIPRSCCRDEKVIPSPCPNDLTNIPFPHTPAIFYKVDTGCIDEINESVRLHIQETFQNAIVMSIFIGIEVLAFLLMFVKRYLVYSKTEVKMKIGDFSVTQNAGSDDQGVGDGRREPEQIQSAAYRASPLRIDSYEGPYAYNTGSVDSIVAAGPGSGPFIVETAPLKELKDTTPYIATTTPYTATATTSPASGNVPYAISGNSRFVSTGPKTNAVFAGLQRQQEAGTGDDNMTINAGNMGRHEIFVAQDMADIPRIVLQPSNDDIGDIVHEEDRPPSPPGSPGGKRKKVRKAGMNHHHKNHKPHKEP